MSDYTALIRADFDRLAPHYREGWSHNTHYHAYLLRHIPDPCHDALDVGCGIGTFTCELARRAHRVTGIDLSPAMLIRARQRAAAFPNVTCQEADIMTLPLAPESVDCIASIAALHHVPLAEVLPRLRAALRPGGVLLVLDLYAAATWRDYLAGAAGTLAHLILQARHGDARRRSPEAEQAWRDHGRHDTYPTLRAAQEAYAAALPGAQIRRHLLWRYSVVWRKSADG